MNGDLTRSTFDPDKHYTSVRHQQGRVTLDADLNEQRAIELHDERRTRIDVIGPSGAPAASPGFQIDANPEPTIRAGRYYVDGIRVENPTDLKFAEQAHKPDTPTEPGLYLAVLHVWERPITAVEDPHLREVALGGPDTTTRTRAQWRVEWLAVKDIGDRSCGARFAEYDALIAPSTGQIEVRLSGEIATDPCSIPEDAGYRGLENQCYRFEVHAGNFDPRFGDSIDPAAQPSFKWSRDNGSVIAAWTVDDGTLTLTVDRLGPGGATGFAPGDWVEIRNDLDALDLRPGVLAEIDTVGQTTLTLRDPDGTLLASLGPKFDPSGHPMVRRWDSAGARATAVDPAEFGTAEVTADGWIRIESGIELRFVSGSLRAGDHWQLPARTAALPGGADQQLDWPTTSAGTYLARTSDGIRHHYARLALFELVREDLWEPLDDCRPIFPPLTDLPQVPGFRTGCGEIGIAPGVDVAQRLVDDKIAVRDADGALQPTTSNQSLALCFQPGRHAIDNLAFRGWPMVHLSGLGAAAVHLHGRLRFEDSGNVKVRDLSLHDQSAQGSRIPAPDDGAVGKRFRWRTRALEARSCNDVTLTGVSVTYLDPRWILKDGQAIHIFQARDARVRDCVVEVPVGQNGIRIQNVGRAQVHGNRVRQRWSDGPKISALSDQEQNELGAWIGRLILQIGPVDLADGPRVDVDPDTRNATRDRSDIRLGIGSRHQGSYWRNQTSILGFRDNLGAVKSRRDTARSIREARRQALQDGAKDIAGLLHGRLQLGSLLSSTTTDPAVVGPVILDRLKDARNALGREILDPSVQLPPSLEALRQRLILSGRWQVGLGGTGIRVAVDPRRPDRQSAITIGDNWVEEFASGIVATFRQGVMGQGRIQDVEIRNNALRLRSPLLPVQRGGIIAGGGRTLRVEGNDIDIAEGSSATLDPVRGFFVGVDGVTVRGSQGSWVGVRSNRIRGCAVGIRRTGRTLDEPDAFAKAVRTHADNAFVGCDIEEIWSDF